MYIFDEVEPYKRIFYNKKLSFTQDNLNLQACYLITRYDLDTVYKKLVTFIGKHEPLNKNNYDREIRLAIDYSRANKPHVNQPVKFSKAEMDTIFSLTIYNQNTMFVLMCIVKHMATRYSDKLNTRHNMGFKINPSIFEGVKEIETDESAWIRLKMELINKGLIEHSDRGYYTVNFVDKEPKDCEIELLCSHDNMVKTFVDYAISNMR